MLQRLRDRSFVYSLALTARAALAVKNLPEDVFVGSASEIIEKHWVKGGTIFVVGAIGAVTRLIAPLLKNKVDDPAVIVLDAFPLNIVPLVGGHQAGAEDLAHQVAAAFGAKAVITGDSYFHRRLALDSFGEAWGWLPGGSSEAWQDLMLRQASFEKVCLEQSSGTKLWQSTQGFFNSFISANEERSLTGGNLHIGPCSVRQCGWHPATLWLGIGCERATSFELLEEVVTQTLQEEGFAPEAVAGIATIDLKSDEPALITLSKEKAWPTRFFNAVALSKVPVPNPSVAVQKEVGTPSVAEAAAILAAQNSNGLRVQKQIYRARAGQQGAVTIAIAESEAPFAPRRGELHLVGSGPGDLSMLTQDARFALARSVVWVGYTPYLDLLEPLRGFHQARVEGKLTHEKDRCKQALDLAMQGVRVALISSGDSGIYGMAGLALEFWMRLPIEARPLFQVHPGVSAFQMAAARSGAPLMQDFCAISLSDYLTPWKTIESRLHAAAQGDFVVALYNPRSIDREWQLKKAIEVFLEYRATNTPVLYSRQLARPNEYVKLFTLATLPIEEVDMLTLVLVGNSASSSKDGIFLTPRGYS